MRPASAQNPLPFAHQRCGQTGRINRAIGCAGARTGQPEPAERACNAGMGHPGGAVAGPPPAHRQPPPTGRTKAGQGILRPFGPANQWQPVDGRSCRAAGRNAHASDALLQANRGHDGCGNANPGRALCRTPDDRNHRNHVANHRPATWLQQRGVFFAFYTESYGPQPQYVAQERPKPRGASRLTKNSTKISGCITTLCRF